MLYLHYRHALAKNPFPRGNLIYNFERPFLGYHYYLCLAVEKKILKENNAFLLYNLFGYAPAQEPLL